MFSQNSLFCLHSTFCSKYFAFTFVASDYKLSPKMKIQPQLFIFMMPSSQYFQKQCSKQFWNNFLISLCSFVSLISKLTID